MVLHSQPITRIALSMTGSQLIVGTSVGSIKLFDTASHQLLRSITSQVHTGGPITHLETMIQPADLIGHVSLSLVTVQASNISEKIPLRSVQPFQRMRDPKARAAHEVHIILKPQMTYTSCRKEEDYGLDELTRDQLSFISPHAGDEQSYASATSPKVQELESEIATLQMQLAEAKGINDMMWEAVAKKLVAEDAGTLK